MYQSKYSIIRKGFTAFFMITLFTIIGCNKDNSTGPTLINPTGPTYSRAWESENKTVCFWISDDRLTLVPESNCDDAAFTARELPANYSNGEPTHITFRYTEQISIRNSKFSITNYKPDPEGSTYSFEFVFNGSQGNGTVTEVNRYGVTSMASFQAVAYLSTIN